LETHGRCAECGIERLTPGIAGDGRRLCVDCAGIPGDHTCRRCGVEARRHRDGSCERCIPAELLRDLLDDGTTDATATVRPELLPLFEALCQMRRPRSGHSWASNPDVQRLLRTLARDKRALTHTMLNDLRPKRTVAHLRDLLMHHGILPVADRDLLLFEAWLADWLPTITHVWSVPDFVDSDLGCQIG
jgi:hypothetical protein